MVINLFVWVVASWPVCAEDHGGGASRRVALSCRLVLIPLSTPLDMQQPALAKQLLPQFEGVQNSLIKLSRFLLGNLYIPHAADSPSCSPLELVLAL
jgi:hypothetical protein